MKFYAFVQAAVTVIQFQGHGGVKKEEEEEKKLILFLDCSSGLNEFELRRKVTHMYDYAHNALINFGLYLVRTEFKLCGESYTQAYGTDMYNYAHDAFINFSLFLREITDAIPASQTS